jgi:hypothetical protein
MSVIGRFDVGDSIVVTSTFRDTSRALTNPSTVVFKVINPNGDVDTYTTPSGSITNPSTGVFKLAYTITSNLPGNWSVRAKGTAGLVTAGEAIFEVRRSAFPTP